MRKCVYFIILAFVVVPRLALININSAEWGDSYRILRASNFVQNLSYPNDEKRPPLFSALLAIRPSSIDAVLWGRIFMLIISFASMFVFYKLSQKFLPTKNQRLLALFFLFFNPVYLYWSLRIYADVPFSLLVMLCFYIFELCRIKQSRLYYAGMGFICGLAILTRFEGYLLTLSILVGVIATAYAGKVSSNGFTRVIIKNLAAYIFPLAIVVIPWLIYRNPLTSSYFEETAGRKYNFEMLLTYLVSYIFVLGVIPAGSIIVTYFFKKQSMNLINAIKKYPHIISFIVLESALILAWPAAVPRLFVPIIPFLVIALVKSLYRVGSQNILALCPPKKTLRGFFLVGIIARFSPILLIAVYIVTQNHLRLQFLGPHTVVFIFVSALSVIASVSIVLNQRKLFIIASIISMLTLSASTIYMHKDIYRSIKEVAVFPLRESRLQQEISHGKIIHNDMAGIVNWYFPQSKFKDFYTQKKYLTQTYITENKIDYIFLTNEFNPNLEIDLKKRPYLELIKESKYSTGGKMFFTWLIKVQK